jgi:predicted transcriptional regulator
MFTLSKNEFEVVSLLWQENRPLSRTEIIALSPDKSWKASSIHILLNSLLKKEAISIAGFVRTGKNYGRTYIAAVSQEHYTAMQLTKTMPSASRGGRMSDVFSALLQTETVDSEVLDEIQEALDQRRLELKKKQKVSG